jgi:hypothetical protein
VARSTQPSKATRRNETVERLSQEAAANLVDTQAQKYLKMSGKEFAREYRAGRIADRHSLAVARVAILLPLVESAGD